MSADKAILILEGLYEFIGKEISWCEENFFKVSESEQYKFGFIAGLKQAQNLLIDLEIEVIKENG